MAEEKTFFIAFILFLLIGLTVSILNDPYIRNRHKKTLLLIIGLCVSLILQNYIEDVLEHDRNIDFRRVFVVHSPSEEGLVRFAIDTVKSCGLFREVLEAMAGCTICTHCGPDTLGLMFMRKE